MSGMSQGQAAEKGWFGAMEEGPGLKPGLIWDGLPRAEARCYSGKANTEILAAPE